MVSVNYQLDKIENHLGDGFWACLRDIILIVLIKVSRPAHHGWYCSLCGTVDYKRSRAAECICCCLLLTVAIIWPATWVLLFWVPYNEELYLELQAKTNPLFPKLLLSVFYPSNGGKLENQKSLRHTDGVHIKNQLKFESYRPGQLQMWDFHCPEIVCDSLLL